MDPVGAFQLAAAIIGVVDFGARLFFDAREIFQSETGRTAHNAQVLALPRELSTLSEQLREHLQAASTTGTRTRSQTTLLGLSQRCIEASKKLQQAVDDLRVNKKANGKFSIAADSFAVALKARWSASEIEDLRKNLTEIRSQMTIAMLMDVWVQQDQSHAELRYRLDEIARRLGRRGESPGQVESSQESAAPQPASQMRAELVDILWKFDWTLWSAGRNGGPVDQAHAWNVPVTIKILSDLSFGEMRNRRAAIPRAHAATFEWIFRDPEPGGDGDELEWPSLPKWLQETAGSVYWITGKPGSGKSTMMKSVFENQLLRFHLQDYSQGLPVMTAGFFFWNPGSTMQKSHEGLVRTLLHQCLNARKHLIPVVAPKQWALYNVVGTDAVAPSWSLQELMESFETLCSLHDIRRFVHAKFDNCPAFQEMKEVYPRDAELLLYEILDKAQGVFLWGPDYRASVNLGEGLRQQLPKIVNRLLNANTRGICELSSDRVELLHRSALDWMTKGEKWTEICSKAPADFEPNLELLEASLVLTSAGKLLKRPRRQDVFSFVRSCFSRMHRIPFPDRISEGRMVQTLDKVNRLACDAVVAGCQSGNISHQLAASYASNDSGGPEGFSGAGWPTLVLGENITHLEFSFVGTAASAGFGRYVKAKVRADGGSLLVTKKGRVSLLESTIFPDLCTVWDSAWSDADFLPSHEETKERRLEIIRFLVTEAYDTRCETALGHPMYDAVRKAQRGALRGKLDSPEWYAQVLQVLEGNGYYMATRIESEGGDENGVEDEDEGGDEPRRWPRYLESEGEDGSVGGDETGGWEESENECGRENEYGQKAKKSRPNSKHRRWERIFKRLAAIVGKGWRGGGRGGDNRLELERGGNVVWQPEALPQASVCRPSWTSRSAGSGRLPADAVLWPVATSPHGHLCGVPGTPPHLPEHGTRSDELGRAETITARDDWG
ncbi:hypothetical protein DL765_009000 [Monosporascus sp. GIB2]|nr:hypothetical protein DL765_009000 [Monosporascus sp. GIB2]